MTVSRAVFADLLNVPKATAVSWERGLRSPSGAAVRLLQIAKNRPIALLETAAHPYTGRTLPPRLPSIAPLRVGPK